MIKFPKFGWLAGNKPLASTSAVGEYRRTIYASELGEPDHIFPGSKPDEVEILAFQRDFSEFDTSDDGYVLLTNGMSDRRMSMPANTDEIPASRAELMWYVREPSDNIVSNLRWLAEFPFIDQTWLGFGHRIPMPWPPISGSDFRTFLLLTPIIKPDQRIAAELAVEGDPVEILTVNLISGMEYELIKTDGLDAFLDLLDEHDYPPIFDPERQSYA